MFKSERQEKLLEILKERGTASVQYLAKHLFASPPTIRRDLTQLEEMGFVKRCFGGAMFIEKYASDIPIEYRYTVKYREKLDMCKLAARFVKDNDVVFIDSSTTTLHVVDFIKDKRNITVVTNSLRVCNQLSRYKINFYCCGGKFLKTSSVFVGRSASSYFADFSADIVFFSSYALCGDGMIQDYSEEETEIRRAMLQHARTKVFMCDESKFMCKSVFNVIGLDKVDAIVTDVPLPSLLEDYRDKNIHL